MKKILKAFAIAALITVSASASQAQIIVRVRPAAPRTVIVRPPAPSPRHVWVREDWRPVNGRYVYGGGYWAAPPRAGARFIAGHWRNTRRGSVWIPGHWV